MSIRQEIRDQAVLELNVAPLPVGVPQASKRRWQPGAEERTAALIVLTTEELTNLVGGRGASLAARRLSLVVQCINSTPTPAVSDDLVEPMLVHVVQRLGNTTLNGLVTRIEEQRTTWEVAKLDRFYLSASVLFVVEYQTKRDDLSSKQ